MKKLKGSAAVFLVIFTFLAALLGVSAKEDKEQINQLHVVFSHDLHSHMDSFRTSSDGREMQIGGAARMKTFLDQERKKYPQMLLVDGGDFSMGTVYQMLFETEASELRMLGRLGYDATTLGNHEFDYRSSGLSGMLKNASESGDSVPAMVVCNVRWPEQLSEGQQMLKDAFDEYGVKPYIMVKKNGLNIAVTGVFGKDALECAPTCELEFEDPVKAVRETVKEIRENEDADMIVCLSHGGTSEDPDKSEDEKLAKEVPELDLIISGHSHTVLSEPIVIGHTSIVACGEYGERLGSLDLVRGDDGRWTVRNYRLVPMDTKIAEDPKILQELQEYSDIVNREYLSDYDYEKDTVIAYNPYRFSDLNELYDVMGEHDLGDLISDAFYYAAAQEAKGTSRPDMAVVPSGCIRDTFLTGPVTAADVFRAYSLGIGPDGKTGYPLIGVYLTGNDLKTAAEIDASISGYMTSARLYMSGLSYTWNPNRMILNKVIRTQLIRQPDEPWKSDDITRYEEIQDDKLYYVVADLYTGQMLGSIEKMSYGLLSIKPRDEQGNEIADLEDYILRDADGNEIKAWDAIADYMQTFDKKNGMPQVSSYYASLHDRKIMEDSSKPVDLLKNPSRYALIICAAAAAAVAVFIVIIVIVVRIIRKHWKKR